MGRPNANLQQAWRDIGLDRVRGIRGYPLAVSYVPPPNQVVEEEFRGCALFVATFSFNHFIL
jgi:hypothetical protein